MTQPFEALPTREERALQTRDGLLTAGRPVFLERGYHATSLEEVARSAGYTKGAVYAHFQDKAELFLTILAAGIEQRVALLSGISEADPAGLARAVVDNHALTQGGDRRWWLLLVEFRAHAARHPELNARYVPLHERLVEAFAALIERCLGVGDARSAATLLLALGTGAALEESATGPLSRPDAEGVVRRLLEGIPP